MMQCSILNQSIFFKHFLIQNFAKITISKLIILLFGLTLIYLFIFIPSNVFGQEEACVICHNAVTPGIIVEWENSRHSEYEVLCSSCHTAKDGDPSGKRHNGFYITAIPSPMYCNDCHPNEAEQYWNSKHAWGAFMGPLKPYYTEARSQGLDPLSQETAKKLNPEEMAKRTLSPLFPDSGALENAGLLNDPDYNHNNVVLGCIECHGSFIIAEPDGKLTGWPNVGVGRINPDGSLGSCTSCHTRHKFSIEEARKPHTCGQCHLGPDHPQMEIYEESKHGNIYDSDGDNWNWDALPGNWGPDDISAPTCATCHMSGFGRGIQTTHDAGARLYWELQPKKSVEQWKGPDEVDLVLERVSDLEQARKGRAEMISVCRQCHSQQWTENYFIEFDKVVNDYNRLIENVDSILQAAYDENLISDDNPIDEIPEIMHYYIWHHDGRRWRMGASMMAPDWTHWNGAVDALLDKYNVLNDWMVQARALKNIQEIQTLNVERLEEEQDLRNSYQMYSIIGIGLAAAAIIIAGISISRRK